MIGNKSPSAKNKDRWFLYREKIIRYIHSLDAAAFVHREYEERKKDRKWRKEPFVQYALSRNADSIRNDLLEIVRRCEDETRCNNDCKNTYFCEKKVGHKGYHQDGGLVWD